MRIIVLGASGQIGSVIFNGLKRAHQVIGTSRKPSLKLRQFDPFDDDWLSLGTADVLINCVGQIEATDSSSFYRIHVELTKRIIEHRQSIGDPRIIQISALGASTEHKVEFLRTKGEADDLLLQHPNTTVVRPSIVCTHRTMIVRKMLMLSNISRFSFGIVTVPKGFLKTKIQPIMPTDLVDLVEKQLYDREHCVVNAVGPESLSFHEIITMMLESRNQKMRLVEISKAIADVMVSTFVSPVFPNVINAQQYQLLFENNVADEKTVTQILGRPLTSTRQFFKDEFSYASN